MKLTDTIETHFRINILQKKALKNLGLETVRDLIYHFPSRYTDMSEVIHIKNAQVGETVTIIGKISGLKTKKSFKSNIPMGQATLADISGKINIVWFHQPYLAKMLTEGSTVRVTGKISESKSYGLSMTNPEISSEGILPIDLHDSLFTVDNDTGEKIEQYGSSVYPESRGVTSLWFYHAIQKILRDECVQNIMDYIPSDIVARYNLPTLTTALVWIHMPKKKDHAEMSRKRFAFEEVFFIQLARQQERRAYDALHSYKLKIPESDVLDFMSRFPFTPTGAQNKAIRTVLDDLSGEKPMSRLIEGDVGSGKTFVAATVAYAVIKNRPKGQNFGNIQVAYMAPTEVLATQLYESFIEYFEHTGISIGLITGSGCRKFPSKSAHWEEGVQVKTWTNISKNQLLKWVKNGEIPIVIGTHALIAKSLEFEDLGLVIIDEQHRFGTNQRMKLAKKEGHAPHYLSMTATPIPRTLALTIYGDLDLSIIDEMPKGRKQTITEIISPAKRESAYEAIRRELTLGRQAYVICPRISDEEDPYPTSPLVRGRSGGGELKSVISEAKRLQKDIFPNYRIGIMHSKMTKQKKEDVMDEFKNHELDILVSTSVIEVGVNVPNATSIIIEGAERFGLAQLHQLRGRVLRSNDQSYCYLFAEVKSEKTMDRLKALKKAASGFELAELDLALRGAGLLSGDKQWGITDLGMDAIKNIKMVEAARTEAIRLTNENPELRSYPDLAQALASKNLHLHFE